MEKIKKVIRKNLPETNSSSSHSVVICVDDNLLVDNSLLPMDENGVIHIPCRENFGWEYEKYNDPMTKIQYVCGILWQNKSNRKMVKKLKDIIINYTGATDVLFEWEEKKKNANTPEDEEENDDYYWESGAPGIDHNSSDIFPEIIESTKSLKNFIFNSKSWLYLGNDNSEAPEGFYEDEDEIEEKKDPFVVVSVNYGGDLGVIDFEFKESTKGNIIYELNREDLIDDVVYDPKTNKFKHLGYLDTKSDDYLYFRLFNLGDSKLYWINKKLEGEIIKRSGIESRYGIIYEYTEEVNNAFRDILKESSWSNYWKSVSYSITFNEFGTVL